MSSLLHLVRQPVLAVEQRLVRFVALQESNVALGVIANSRQQLEPVWKLDDIVVGSERKRLGFDRRFFLGREHDQRRLAGRLVSPEPLDQSEAVDLGHDQVLKDHRGIDPVGFIQRLGSIAIVMKVDIRLARDHAANSLADHRLVVH
jgi:hypothetical protein